MTSSSSEAPLFTAVACPSCGQSVMTENRPGWPSRILPHGYPSDPTVDCLRSNRFVVPDNNA